MNIKLSKQVKCPKCGEDPNPTKAVKRQVSGQFCEKGDRDSFWTDFLCEKCNSYLGLHFKSAEVSLEIDYIEINEE